MATTQKPTEQPKLVDGSRLLELLFDEQSRPSQKWLRAMAHARKIPSVRMGKVYFYNLSAVRKAVSL